jgi:hypothetical protein
MKKRQFTTLLLIWLFSQQLFAAIWVMPHMNVDCVDYSQNDCFSGIAHNRHNIPSDSGASSSGDMPMTCDHCSTACQPLLISHHLVGLIPETHLIVDTQSLNTPINTFLSTLYRPPILS